MMKEILAELGLDKSEKGRFGIELETEVDDVNTFGTFAECKNKSDAHSNWKFKSDSKFWKPVADGSLRHDGVEFVLKKPLDYRDVEIALEEFCSRTEGVKFYKDSPSTSTHVHVNVLDLTFKEFHKLIVAYILFENVLVEFSGERRRSNLFALPIRCCEHLVTSLHQMFKQSSVLDYSGLIFNENTHKYGALNMCSLMKFGSIEFRSFRGESDPKKILQWVSFLQCLVSVAKDGQEAPEFVRDVTQDPIKMFWYVFGSGIDPDDLLTQFTEQHIEANMFNATKLSTHYSEGMGEIKPAPKMQKSLGKSTYNLINSYFNASYSVSDTAMHVGLSKELVQSCFDEMNQAKKEQGVLGTILKAASVAHYDPEGDDDE